MRPPQQRLQLQSREETVKQSLPIQSGSLMVDTDAGTWTLLAEGVLPTIPPPNPGPDPAPGFPADAIPMDQITIVASPDVRGWPVGAALTVVGLSFSASQVLEFTKRNGPGSWPFVIGAEGGEIQYTLWVVCNTPDGWAACGVIRCISRAPNDNYVPTGPTLAPGQLPTNWYYFAPWPLGGYQPQPGEPVGWFLTAGDQRRGDIHTITERTNIVVAPFSPGTFTFPV